MKTRDDGRRQRGYTIFEVVLHGRNPGKFMKKTVREGISQWLCPCSHESFCCVVVVVETVESIFYMK